MKKLLTLVLGIVLFSGAAAAKLYWLPDYQNEDMKARDRVFDPENNRNDTCADEGMYDSPLSSNCYNCSVSASSSHKACYSCTAKPVPAGKVTKAVCYAKTNGSNGWIWTSSGICSGTEIYGTCTAKTCDSNYQTSATLCRTTGAYGWTLDKNTECYAGATTKYKCKALTCPSGYSTTYSNVSKCGSTGSKGWSWEKSSQYAGNSVCGKCRKLSCNSPYISGVKECSPADGYTLKQDSGRYNGDTVCGYCQPNNCSGKTKQSDCNTSNGYTFTKTCKSGTTIYGDCKPNVCSGTKKSDCNTANGYIFTANCKSAGVDYGTCKAATCPTGYSTSYQSVANCGSTGSSGWTFSSKGKSGGKVCGKCTAKTCSSCKTSVASCGSSGSKGWTLGTSVVCTAGDTKCYSCSKKSCSSGVVKSACDTASGAKIWTAISGVYSGNDQCGKCEDAKKDCRTIIAELPVGQGGTYVSTASELENAVLNSSGDITLYVDGTISSGSPSLGYTNRGDYSHLTFKAASKYCDDAKPAVLNMPNGAISVPSMNNEITINVASLNAPKTNADGGSGAIANYGTLTIKALNVVSTGPSLTLSAGWPDDAYGGTRGGTISIDNVIVANDITLQSYGGNIIINKFTSSGGSKKNLSFGIIASSNNINISNAFNVMNVGNINVLSSSLIYFDEKYCPTSFSVTSVNNSMINGKCAITNGVTATVKYYIQCNYENCTNYMG